MDLKAYPLLAIFLFSTFALGFYGSPLSEINPEEDLDVEAEYLSGILTAYGIIFGLWGIILQKNTKEEYKKWQIKNIIQEPFFISLLLLIIFVFVIACTAVNLFSPSIALFFGTMSFGVHSILFAVNIYFYRFKETL